MEIVIGWMNLGSAIFDSKMTAEAIMQWIKEQMENPNKEETPMDKWFRHMHYPNEKD